MLGDADLPVKTVFVGGGTPTLLPPEHLGRMLAAVRDEFGLAPHAEVTTEANPDSVDEAGLAALREAGFTRVSFGMQSASSGVLAVLERTHTPGRAEAAVAEARRAGFDHINVDLIYATPGESDDDWRRSLDAAVGSGADHVSAYSLIVGYHAAGRAGAPRRAPPGRRRHRRSPLRDGRRGAHRGGDDLVRGVQLVPAGRAVPPQPRVLARGSLVGGGPGCPFARRRGAVVDVRHPAAYAEALRSGRSPERGARC